MGKLTCASHPAYDSARSSWRRSRRHRISAACASHSNSTSTAVSLPRGLERQSPGFSADHRSAITLAEPLGVPSQRLINAEASAGQGHRRPRRPCGQARAGRNWASCARVGRLRSYAATTLLLLGRARCTACVAPSWPPSLQCSTVSWPWSLHAAARSRVSAGYAASWSTSVQARRAVRTRGAARLPARACEPVAWTLTAAPVCKALRWDYPCAGMDSSGESSATQQEDTGLEVELPDRVPSEEDKAAAESEKAEANKLFKGACPRSLQCRSLRTRLREAGRQPQRTGRPSPGRPRASFECGAAGLVSPATRWSAPSSLPAAPCAFLRAAPRTGSKHSFKHAISLLRLAQGSRRSRPALGRCAFVR